MKCLLFGFTNIPTRFRWCRNERMCRNSKQDLTVMLPDEVLIEVFGHVSSLRDLFSLAAVNQKFRRCVLIAFRKPMPLEMDFTFRTPISTFIQSHKVAPSSLTEAVDPKWSCWSSLSSQNANCYRLNGPMIHQDFFPTTLKLLADKTNFNRISISGDFDPNNSVWSNRMRVIIDILTSTDCLDHVTQFKSDLTCSSMVFESLIAKCEKLSILDLCAAASTNVSVLKLIPSVANKPLTKLKLGYFNCPSSQLIELLQCIKPNNLRELTLSHFRSLNLAEMAKELCCNGWAALEVLTLMSVGPSSAPPVDKFFAQLPLLPSLRSCNFMANFFYFDSNQAFESMLTLLGNNNGRENHLDVVMVSDGGYCDGCQLIEFFHRLQRQYEAVKVDLNWDKRGLKFELGNISYTPDLSTRKCDQLDCVMCSSFYPLVIDALADAAVSNSEDMHLEHFQLDSCRVKQVVDDLNAMWCGFRNCKALCVELHANIATIAFETTANDQLKISVNTGDCFNKKCLECFIFD